MSVHNVNTLPGSSGPQSEPLQVALYRRIKGALAELAAALDKFRTRPDRGSQVALDELRESLQLVRNAFYDYEIPADRLVGEVTQGAIEEIRRLIRTQRKAIDDLLWDLPHRAPEGRP
jgi:hypothetical protein